MLLLTIKIIQGCFVSGSLTVREREAAVEDERAPGAMQGLRPNVIYVYIYIYICMCIYIYILYTLYILYLVYVYICI